MNDIEKYQGYLWWSNSSTPEVIDGNHELPITFDEQYSTLLSPSATQKPFIVEGNLWDVSNRVSIYIKYVDGEYIVRRVDTAALDRDDSYEKTEASYKPHRMSGKMKFRQYWKAESDPLCEVMRALRPDMFVFMGFEE